MKSKTSYFDKGLVWITLKDYWWIGLTHLVLLTLVTTFKIVDLNSLYYTNHFDFLRVLHLQDGSGQIVLILLFPVLTAGLLFRYLHSKGTVDLLHSLPMKREALFTARSLIGVLVLVLPILITAGSCLLLRQTMSLEKYYSGGDVGAWVLLVVTYEILFFSAAVFFGMLTGMMILQPILTYVFLSLPVLLGEVSGYVLRLILPGYMTRITPDSFIVLISPAYSFVSADGRLNNTTPIPAYLLASLLLLVFAMIIYKQRGSEAASEAIGFPILKGVFQYGVAFCSMMVFGAYFQSINGGSEKLLVIGMVFGGSVGYFCCEMLMKKSLWVFENYKGLLVFAVAIAVLYGGIKMDVTGYTSRVPSIDQVVYACHDNFYDQATEQQLKRNSFQTKENIQRVIELHQQAIHNSGNYSKNAVNIELYYKLKDGKELKRYFSVSSNTYDKFLKSVFSTKEFKRIHYPYVTLASEDVDWVTLNPTEGSGKSRNIIDKEKITQFLKELKLDVMSLGYNQIAEDVREQVNVIIQIKSDKRKEYFELQDQSTNSNQTGFNIQLYSNYTNAMKWLKKEGIVFQNQ